MSTATISDRQPRGYLAPEVVLAIAGLLTFVLIPVHINTIYEGLPAHPLLIHVPVMLIPLAGIGALVLAARPSLFGRHCVWLCGVAVVALGALNLTMGAGDQLRSDLGLNQAGFGPSDLIARHAHAASILRIFMIAFTAVFIVAVAIARNDGGERTGISWIDGPVEAVSKLTRGVSGPRIVLALVAIGCLYFVFKTGDLGAKAVWANRLHGFGLGGAGGGGGSGGGFGTSGGGGGSGVSGLFSPSSGGG